MAVSARINRWLHVMNGLKNTRLLFFLFTGVAVFGSLAKYFQAPQLVDGHEFTSYNNFLIFKYSFFNLIGEADLYQPSPEQFIDLFFYSPTFAFLIGPLASLPNLPGLLSWSLLNSLTLFFSISRLPLLAQPARIYLLWFILIELTTSIQNFQSNALIAGLIIFSFTFLEKRHVGLASLFIILTVYIKLFGGLALLLGLLYPDKIKFAAYSICWSVAFFLLPLIVVSPEYLIHSYQSWAHLLMLDYSSSGESLSIMGWLQSWFQIQWPQFAVMGVGATLLGLPLVRRAAVDDRSFRLLFLASLMLWVVIFNHKAESPTFIIAICGIGLWFIAQETRAWHLAFLLLSLVLTSLSVTDIVPRAIENRLIDPYRLKVVPSIFVWFWCQYLLLVQSFPPKDSRGGSAVSHS